jgi:hypothetical protein
MPKAKKKGRVDQQRLHQQSEVFRALSRAVLDASTAAGHLEQYDCLDDHPSIPLGEIGKHWRDLQQSDPQNVTHSAHLHALSAVLKFF